MTIKSKLETADEVIDAAGGTSKVAKHFGVSIPTVCIWRKKGLPASRYLQWQEVLSALDKSAPASLWGQK
jgi:hypothetical protein